MNRAFVRRFSGSAALLGKYKSTPQHRGSLSQKRQPRGWYKGSGTPTVGFHTRKGGFIVQQERVGKIVLPAGLATTDLKPYVSKRTPLIAASPPNFEELRDAMIAEHNGSAAAASPVQQEN